MYRLMAEDKARHGDDNHDTLPLTISYQILLNHPRLINSKITVENLKQIIGSIGYKMLDHDRIILSEDPLTSTHEDFHDHEHDSNHQNEVVEKNSQSDHNEECWD
jgi:hypothetical protein